MNRPALADADDSCCSKAATVVHDSSWIFRFTPYIVFVAPIFGALLIPVLTNYPLFFAFMGDMLGGGFILSLGGFFAALAAVDAAKPSGPMGASRTRMVGFLAEPVFMIVFFTVSFVAGSTIPYIVQEKWVTPLANFFAPSHILLVLAGATLNFGLYGILRVNADLLPAVCAGPGLIALVVGTASTLLGILYATTENDLKTMLAYSSIENVGLIVAGFGAGMVFVAAHHPMLAAIAFVAALYHLINHSFYKTLLFLGVGAVETQTGTRDLDRLGGLIKVMRCPPRSSESSTTLARRSDRRFCPRAAWRRCITGASTLTSLTCS